MKIAIIGAGAWGTTLASLIADNNPDKEVVIWAREKKVVDSINRDDENSLFLKGVKLSSNLSCTNQLEEVKDADFIFTAIPSQFLRDNAKELSRFIKQDATVINVSKGLEVSSFKRMSQVLKEELPNTVRIVALSGPNHAEEVSRKIPTATVIASEDADLEQLKKILENDYFKVYPHDDIIGTELCGAVKNITAIATGVIDGLGMGDNAHGSIITLGLREMVKLGKAMGAREQTCYGLAGVGDLVATCTSTHSRNRFVGQKLAEGLNFDQIKKEMHGQVAEGIMTCKAVHEYAVKNNITLPLTAQAYKVLFEEKKLKNAIEDLKGLL